MYICFKTFYKLTFCNPPLTTQKGFFFTRNCKRWTFCFHRKKKWNTLFFIFFYSIFLISNFFETNWDSWLIMLNSYFTSKFSKLVFDWFRVVLLLTFLWGFFMRNCCNGINVQSEEGETSNVNLFHTQLKVNPGSRRGLVWVKFSSFRVLSQHHQHNLIWIY